MLFPYTYVSHQMEKMQEFIDFIFYEVWCKAPGYGPFSLDLFLPNPDLYEVMNAFHYSDSQGSEFFLGHVQRIFELFTTLDDAQIEQFRQWYQANNDIEKVCANDSSISVARYADLPTKLNGIKDQLKSFFKNLYSYLNLAALKEKIGEIGDHYNEAFSGANRSGKCPFCGISDMKGPDHDYREAYDHYLPKALYPFNSVNFRNLVMNATALTKRARIPSTKVQVDARLSTHTQWMLTILRLLLTSIIRISIGWFLLIFNSHLVRLLFMRRSRLGKTYMASRSAIKRKFAERMMENTG